MSLSWDTACMPRPILVRLMKYHRRAEHTSRAPMVKIADRWRVTPPTSSAGPVTTSICGKGILLLALGKLAPGTLSYMRRTNSCRKTEIPIAVISGANRGALRSGR